MAGLFNVFNEANSSISVSAKQGKENTFSSSRLKSVGNVGLTSAKSFVQQQSKPKGLSIRSKSDLNVYSSSHLGPKKNVSKNCLKIENKQAITNKLSPKKMKTPKNKFDNISTKKLSPKVLSPIMQNVMDDFVFKKPVTPKESKKLISCPPPENLAYDFDHFKYMEEEVKNMFEEERELLKSAYKKDDSIISLEDEGFISDPEVDSLDFRTLSPLPEWSLTNEIDLPEISDCED